MRLWLPLLLATNIAAADVEAVYRDWTVERPMLAGFLSGLSLTTCGQCKLGSQSVVAGAHDPFGMSEKVREELKRVGEAPYRGGQAVGALSALMVILGVFFRRLNTLRLRQVNSSAT